MHLSMRIRYKTQLATTLSGVPFGLPAHLRIFDQVASEPSHAKPRACIFIVFMCGFFAVFHVIHPNPFTVHRLFSHGFVEKFSNNAMLCVSLVLLFSSGQYRLEFNRQKLRKLSMIHWQPAFERNQAE